MLLAFSYREGGPSIKSIGKFPDTRGAESMQPAIMHVSNEAGMARSR
jgi:hypothetical protein